MVIRTQEDDCLLCQLNKATKKGSHMIPASLVDSMVGKRNKEESYKIRPASEAPIDVAFGRGNLKNTNPEHKQIQFVKDFVFCPECEGKLAVLENEINPVLTTKIKDSKQKQNFPETKLPSGISYLTCEKVNTDVFKLYVLSLLWRLHISYYLEIGKPFLRNEDSDWIRLRLIESVGINIKENNQKCDSKLLEQLPFVLCGCLEDIVKDESSEEEDFFNLAIPHPDYIRPYCFLFNNFLVVFGFTSDQLESVDELIHLKHFSVNKKLLNTTGPIKVVVIKPDSWLNFTKIVFGSGAREFVMERAQKISQKYGLTLEESDDKIRIKINEIRQGTEKRYGDWYDEAFKILMAAAL